MSKPPPPQRRRARIPAKAGSAAPGLSAGREFQRLVDLMARLRAPDGCPWDREQTIESLRGFVLEETYEVLDAIDRADHAALLGEIGDLLFEGVFLAQVESDDGHFTVADSLRAITAKLVRRHPHIFGEKGTRRRTAGLVPQGITTQWEEIKSREQKDAGERHSLLRGVPKTMPSLLRAHEIGTRVGAVGFEWTHVHEVVDKIEEEVAELRRAIAHEGQARSEEEMGDLLFTLANLSRRLGIEPESALRKANEKFSARFEAVERALETRGRSVHDSTLGEMGAEWKAVKSREAAAGKAVPPRALTAGTKTTKNANNTKKNQKKTNTDPGRPSGSASS